MKRYRVILVHYGREYVFDVPARNEKSACNKAVKRANFSSRIKTITSKNVVGVQYLGFYLARRFFSVEDY